MDDVAFLHQAIDLAAESRAHGNHPFGALLVNADGEVVCTALNTVDTDNDPTGHAETNLVRVAGKRFDPDIRATLTLYTSTEPCAMCAGAIYWARIRTVVFALGENELRAMTGDDVKNPTMSLPCREVFARGRHPTAVRGPFDILAAREVHAGFWHS
ncbi:MAG: tRNA-specific adenosine deaminase [Gordonia sp.]|uniref:nucleoside deaminase n=1 Tax=Gordonia sp. (in: high G+C Gram-positive bacteria) TaxID=84139 RepID=UPI000C4ECAC8|nr:nucleoside deaminase [Gordonia sp. (in: high G+C Gram-positive bacteria)]MAU81844.1 tRNA-specific adenosine deaminase [Gordonia sp. (in: high G+C Gram-positive bacteria)]